MADQIVAAKTSRGWAGSSEGCSRARARGRPIWVLKTPMLVWRLPLVSQGALFLKADSLAGQFVEIVGYCCFWASQSASNWS